MEAIDLVKEFKQFLDEKYKDSSFITSPTMYPDPIKLQYKPAFAILQKKEDLENMDPEEGFYFKRFTITINDHVERKFT